MIAKQSARLSVHFDLIISHAYSNIVDATMSLIFLSYLRIAMMVSILFYLLLIIALVCPG